MTARDSTGRLPHRSGPPDSACCPDRAPSSQVPASPASFQLRARVQGHHEVDLAIGMTVILTAQHVVVVLVLEPAWSSAVLVTAVRLNWSVSAVGSRMRLRELARRRPKGQPRGIGEPTPAIGEADASSCRGHRKSAIEDVRTRSSPSGSPFGPKAVVAGNHRC
jgi:hypothetical protein